MRRKLAAMIMVGAIGACDSRARPAPLPANDVVANDIGPAVARQPAPADAVDPKSAAAAMAVVRRYADLIEQHDFAAARHLWSDGGRASGLTEAEFTDAFARYRNIHASTGQPGEREGAAGSTFITVPLRLAGTYRSGKPFDIALAVVLRRSNDVPGSTLEQRRWHIAQDGLPPRG